MSSLHIDDLMDSISQLHEIQYDVLRDISEEISTARITYRSLYTDFHSGGWHTAILYSPDGESSNGTVRDGVARPSALVKDLPITQRFFEKLGLDLFTARVARNDPDSWLWEHRDYIELEEGRKRLRLHVPLVTNPDAAMQFSQHKVYVACGWIWKLDPTISHAISNTGVVPRIHLILDCYVNEALQRMLNDEILEEKYVQVLCPLGFQMRNQYLTQAQDLFVQEGRAKAEEHLLKLFHQFDLGTETSYDLLIDFYHNMGFKGRENYWIAEQIARVHHREKTEFSMLSRNSRGTLFSNPHAMIACLPHFNIFMQILRTCRNYAGLEQVYVRGSLARGDADPHSDIDLLCVVAPHEFASYVDQIDVGIREQHNPVSARWVDTIVKDFGGVGFVYLVEFDKQLYQLDLYVACQGHPSLDYLDRVPHKQEIFRQSRRKGSDRRHETLHYRLLSAAVKQKIQSIRNEEPSVSQTLTELNVLAFMVKRSLSRGDEFVASDRYNMWKHCFIKLVRHRFDTQHRDYGFYHVKRLIVEAKDNGMIYKDICAINNSPPTNENLLQAHLYAMDFANSHFLDDFTRQGRMIRAVSRHLEGYKPQPLATLLTSWSDTTLNTRESI